MALNARRKELAASRRALYWNLPPEQEKVVTAKRAPVGLKKPFQGSLQGISSAGASKFDGPAMRAACREEPCRDADHESTSVFAAGAARPGDGAE
jgi:hypothetical protein